MQRVPYGRCSKCEVHGDDQQIESAGEDCGGRIRAPCHAGPSFVLNKLGCEQKKTETSEASVFFACEKRSVRRVCLATTYSPTGVPAVPSALDLFTAEFGMGSGVDSPQ